MFEIINAWVTVYIRLLVSAITDNSVVYSVQPDYITAIKDEVDTKFSRLSFLSTYGVCRIKRVLFH